MKLLSRLLEAVAVDMDPKLAKSRGEKPKKWRVYIAWPSFPGSECSLSEQFLEHAAAVLGISLDNLPLHTWSPMVIENAVGVCCFDEPGTAAK